MIQVVDVLGQLNSIAEQMFSKLRDKAETQKRIIDSITARISAASAKAALIKKESIKSTVVVSPASYPKSNPTHYQNLFTPLPAKPDLLSNSPVPVTKKGGLSKISPNQVSTKEEPDISFSIIEQQYKQYARKTGKGNEKGMISSIDEILTFGTGNTKKSKKQLSLKKKEDIDPEWVDFMNNVKRDSRINYVPGYKNCPEAHLPEHLIASNIATNISLEKKTENSIAPSLYLDLPSVGTEPTPNQSTLPLPPSNPSVPQPPTTPLPPSNLSVPVPHDMTGPPCHNIIPTTENQTLSIKKESPVIVVSPSRPLSPDQNNNSRKTQLPEVIPTVLPEAPKARISTPLNEEPIKKQSPPAVKEPALPSGPENRPASIPPPPPPPPPPKVRPAQPRPVVQSRPKPVEPPKQDHMSLLYQAIIKRRPAMEEEPERKVEKKTQESDDWQ
jgi:hypothetical protein